MPLTPVKDAALNVVSHPAAPAVTSLGVLGASLVWASPLVAQDPAVVGELVHAASGADTNTLLIMIALQACSAIAAAVLAWAKARESSNTELRVQLTAKEKAHDADRELIRDLRVELAKLEIRAEIDRRQP